MYIRLDHSGLSRLARDFQRAGAQNRTRELAKGLRIELKPLVAPTRAAILATPSKGDKRSKTAVAERPLGLRQAEAKGVVVKVALSGRNATAAIRIATRHFPRGSKSLIAYREGTRTPHRSPNWGRNDWKSQTPRPAFFPTLNPLIPGASARVEMHVVLSTERAIREGLI